MKRSFHYLYLILVGLSSCSSAKLESTRAHLYFASRDTLLIAGFMEEYSRFSEIANEEIYSAFEKCKVASVMPFDEFHRMILKKVARQRLDMTSNESFSILKSLGLSGYVIDASIVQYDETNSFITFTSKTSRDKIGPNVTSSNPDICFRFRIFHIESETLALETFVKITLNSIIVGENGDDDIGLNRGLDHTFPLFELRKALKKTSKICNCR